MLFVKNLRDRLVVIVVILICFGVVIDVIVLCVCGLCDDVVCVDEMVVFVMFVVEFVVGNGVFI